MSRIVKLTDEQAEIARNYHNHKCDLDLMLTNLVYGLSERLAMDHCKFWDQMYEIADVDPETHKITVNYISGSLKIEEIDENS